MPGLFVRFFKTRKVDKKGSVWVGLGQRSNVCEQGLRALKLFASPVSASCPSVGAAEVCAYTHTCIHMHVLVQVHV